MRCSDSCPCKQSAKTPFYCHCGTVPYSREYIVPLGHSGSLRLFDICNPDIAGIAVEQAIVGGGSRVERDLNNKCKIVCVRTRKNWYDYKMIENCCCTSSSALQYRPFLLQPHHDNEIVLPAGCFRFTAYDCDYNLITPNANDIAMLLTIEKC